MDNEVSGHHDLEKLKATIQALRKKEEAVYNRMHAIISLIDDFIADEEWNLYQTNFHLLLREEANRIEEHWQRRVAALRSDLAPVIGGAK